MGAWRVVNRSGDCGAVGMHLMAGAAPTGSKSFVYSAGRRLASLSG